MLRNAAVALKGGGVGFYPKSDFVHVELRTRAILVNNSQDYMSESSVLELKFAK